MRQQRHNPFSHISSLHKQRELLDVVYPNIYVEGLLLKVGIGPGPILDQPWIDLGSTLH